MLILCESVSRNISWSKCKFTQESKVISTNKNPISISVGNVNMWSSTQYMGGHTALQPNKVKKTKTKNSRQLTSCSQNLDPGYNAANVLHLLRSIVHRRCLSQTVVQLEDNVKRCQSRSGLFVVQSKKYCIYKLLVVVHIILIRYTSLALASLWYNIELSRCFYGVLKHWKQPLCCPEVDEEYQTCSTVESRFCARNSYLLSTTQRLHEKLRQWRTWNTENKHTLFSNTSCDIHSLIIIAMSVSHYCVM